MDMEHVEEVLDIERIVKDAGYISLEHFERFKTTSAMGFIHFGGSFLVHLGEALQRAELRDALKITRYWHQECSQYSIIYRGWVAKEMAMAVEKMTLEEINEQKEAK